MNYPIWEVPASGLFIASIAILHVFISHFAVGGGLFLVLAERKARRENDHALLAWVRGMSRFFILLTLVLGAVTGVGIWFTIGLIHPPATSSLINTFVWGWAIEGTFFVAEIAAALVYYYGWDRLSAKVHMIVGWIYFWAAWLSMVVINGILSYMLTPGEWIATRGFWDGILNPTYWPMLVARTFGAAGIAGLYALFTASFSKDTALKEKVASWVGWRWVLPAAIVVPLALYWSVRVASSWGVPVAALFGAKGVGVGELLAGAFGGGTTGYPAVQHAGRTLFAAFILTIALAAWVVIVRRRSYRPVEGVLLLVIGILAMGGAEWVREGLRKPYIIGRFMFSNGVRLPAPEGIPRPPADAPGSQTDRFALDQIERTGVLAAAQWDREVLGFDSLSGTDPNFDPATRIAAESAAGREVFKVLCATCHTIDGYQGIRPLVAGKTPDALEGTLSRLALPTGADGAPSSWSDPKVVPAMWLGRGMPPFVGTAAEKRALAVYLAGLGGMSPSDLAASVPSGGGGAAGAKVFEGQCSACHGAGTDWPIEARIKGRSADQFYEMMGRLPEINDAMPAFEGTDEERRALAEWLAGLGGAAPGAPEAGKEVTR